MNFSKYTLALLIILATALCVMHSDAKTWVSCPEGYYINSSNPRKLKCSKCTPFDNQDPYRVLDAHCTPYEDTIISCVAGFYYVRDPDGGSCYPCSKKCPPTRPFLRQECFSTMDRICCKENETIVRKGKCEKLVYCTENEHLALHGRQTNRESCQPCPAGFVNAKKKHRDFKCQEKEDAIGQENYDHRSSAGTISNNGHRSSGGTISLLVPFVVIVMRFY